MNIDLAISFINTGLGLHFLPPGYKFLYEGIMETIKLRWPDQDPLEKPFILPSWEEARKA